MVVRHVARPEADFRCIRFLAGEFARHPARRRDRDEEEDFHDRCDDYSNDCQMDIELGQLHVVLSLRGDEKRFVTGEKESAWVLVA